MAFRVGNWSARVIWKAARARSILSTATRRSRLLARPNSISAIRRLSAKNERQGSSLAGSWGAVAGAPPVPGKRSATGALTRSYEGTNEHDVSVSTAVRAAAAKGEICLEPAKTGISSLPGAGGRLWCFGPAIDGW